MPRAVPANDVSTIENDLASEDGCRDRSLARHPVPDDPDVPGFTAERIVIEDSVRTGVIKQQIGVGIRLDDPLAWPQAEYSARVYE